MFIDWARRLSSNTTGCTKCYGTFHGIRVMIAEDVDAHTAIDLAAEWLRPSPGPDGAMMASKLPILRGQ